MNPLDRAAKLKSELDALRPLDPKLEARIMQKLRLDWNYHSNNLEGNTLTYGETKALIMFGVTAQGKPLRDHFEITGHNEAINWATDLVKNHAPLTEKFIRELHTLILKEDHFQDALTPDGMPTRRKIHVGKYKSQPNHVKTITGEIFYFATPEETPARMHDLVEWFRVTREIPSEDPIRLACNFHYKFIRIHPFDDGNGRIARILMNFILMQFGYPPVILKTEDKENYFAVLRLADAGELYPFVEYVTVNLVRSLEIMIRGAKGEEIEDSEDLDKELALLEARLSNVRNPVNLTLRKDKFRGILFGWLRLLLSMFISRCEKFERFYSKSKATLSLDGHVISYDKNRMISELLDSEFRFLESARLSIRYDFKSPLYGQADDRFSQIDLDLRTDLFVLTGIDGGRQIQQITKNYDDLVSEDEVLSLVRALTAIHKHEIEKFVESIER